MPTTKPKHSKDAIMMGAALVTMVDSAKAYLRRRRAAEEGLGMSKDQIPMTKRELIA